MGFLAGYLAAQLKLLVRSRSSLFWVILFPLVMTLIFGGVFGSPGSIHVKTGVVVEDDPGSPVVRGLLEALNSSPATRGIVVYGTQGELVEALRSPPPGGVEAGVVVPRGFTANLTGGHPAVLEVLYLDIPEAWANTSTQVVLGVVEGYVDRLREVMLGAVMPHVPREYRGYVRVLVEPVEARLVPVEPRVRVTAAQVRAWIAISMALVEALFIGLSLGATSFHEERRLGILHSMLSSPLGSWSLLAARLSTILAYVAVATLVSLATGAAIGASYSFSPGGFLVAALVVTLATLFSASLGLLIAALTEREDAAEALAMTVAFPLMFLSGLWVPKWLLPRSLRELAGLIPIGGMADAARAALVYGEPPGEALAYTPPGLLLLTAIFIALGLLAYRRLLERSIERGW